MSEWLDLMIDEVNRKKQERKEAEEEHERRSDKSVQSPKRKSNTESA